MGFKMAKPQSEITLESEYEKIKEMDIDHWEQKRGPRPWEETFDQENKQKKRTNGTHGEHAECAGCIFYLDRKQMENIREKVNI